MEELTLWKQKYIHHLELQRGLRQNSLRAIQKDLEQFLRYIEDCQEGEFTVLAMKSYFFSLQEKHAASTVHRKLSSIKVFLRFLKEEDIVKEDFSLYFTKVRKEEDVILFFETNVWEKFRKSFEEDIRDRAIFELLYSTGMKPKELLSLVYMQIHWEKQEIYFFQKKETRTIFFSQRAKEALWNYCEEKGIREGNIWDFSEKTLRNIFMKYREKIPELEHMTIYSFRHSFTIQLLRAGMPKVELQYLLGLEQGELFQRYEAYL
ncbi:recombinase XerD [Fusobacterium necrophorum]|uniref:Tyrosine recombinase XerD n=2 Tax=Fusobacterium necrophorum TaxID=859 RepID=A0AB73BZH4_9FUSO|nr:tyrosine-type recombinase/integrase [Fusobacterium necrophorum]AYZ73878.1 recombinase XerD [Fusobacterium necrophorum]AZW10244.1 recombinase XerD [Fusobacterium necrophorum subsp. necrophorum]KDE60902.1 tyrosine recombinase XerD [Fusobacterium necrophorum BFTR-1]KDE64889.1 tyrosine recombinase XerD [Fusobacterium necrophorum DJ-1]KDE65518.1 tyrosine recombinase XerD [Fusobacterium necrophorum BL]